MTPDAILARLAEITKLQESHRAAVFVLEQQRVELYAQLRATDWKPPEVPA
jgi:hypothetical protein